MSISKFLNQVEHDTLPYWPWRNDYILTLESFEKVDLGFLNTLFDTKSEYQPQKAEKSRFSKFILQVEHDTQANWHWKKWLYFDPGIIWEGGSWVFKFTFWYQIRISTTKSWKMLIFKIHPSGGAWHPAGTDHEEMTIFWPWNHLRRWLLGF